MYPHSRDRIPQTGARAAGSSEEMSQIRSELAVMQSALEQLRDKETFIVQGRSRRHHVIAVPEAAHPPAAWTTVCGWRYGLSQFYRGRRCFHIDGAGSEEPSRDSEGDSDDKSSSSSSSSSSSDSS